MLTVIWFVRYHRVPTIIALDIGYGYVVQGRDDPFANRVNRFAKYFERAAALSIDEGFIVNWFPLREYHSSVR